MLKPSRSTSTIETTTPSGDIGAVLPGRIRSVPDGVRAWRPARRPEPVPYRASRSRSACALTSSNSRACATITAYSATNAPKLNATASAAAPRCQSELKSFRVSAAAPSHAATAISAMLQNSNRNAFRLFFFAWSLSHSGNW